MKYAKNGNRFYPVETEQEQAVYLARGFDIFEIDGDHQETVIARNPSAKISYAEHENLLADAVIRIEEITEMNQKLQKEIADLKKATKGNKPEGAAKEPEPAVEAPPDK